MKTFKVEGMKCVHCQQRVHDAVEKVAGGQQVTVSLEDGSVTVDGECDAAAVIGAVESAGFGCEEQ